jgi:hypothetical protein
MTSFRRGVPGATAGTCPHGGCHATVDRRRNGHNARGEPGGGSHLVSGHRSRFLHGDEQMYGVRQHAAPQALDEHCAWLPREYTPLIQKRAAARIGCAILPKCLPCDRWGPLTPRSTALARRTYGNTSPGLTKCRPATGRGVMPAPSRMRRPDCVTSDKILGGCRLQPPRIIERFPPPWPPDGGNRSLPLNRAPPGLCRGHREGLGP